MKLTTYALVISFALFGCTKVDKQSSHQDLAKTKNEVLILGTIHSGHLTQESYNLNVLRGLIEKIQPDIILTEIPPDRFPTALKEFQETDSIQEPRVKRFPEYVDVIFPLSKSMDFTLIPTAGWTKEMAVARSKKLKEISENPDRTDDWQQYQEASKRTRALLKGVENQFDPFWINSDAYDEIVEIELGVYNKLFNEELGLGGWDNINEAHYSHIENALDTYKNQGKRILITYGAGHKGWFLRALKKRADILLLDLADFKD